MRASAFPDGKLRGILRKIAEGADEAALLSMYPHLTREDIQAAVTYAADALSNAETLEIGSPA
jgi:uncharacterized protein (DUF433 family)